MRSPAQTLIAFDFDGTIIDTELAEHAAWQSIAESFGLENLADRVRSAIVHGPQHNTKSLSREVANLVGRQEFEIDSMYRRALWKQESLLELRPEALSLLEQCAAIGYRMILFSGATHAWFGQFLFRHDLFRFFELECGQNTWAEGQSKVDVYRYLRGHYALQGVSEFIAVEDSPRGVTAAREGGWKTILLPNALISESDMVGISVNAQGQEAARLFLDQTFERP